MTTRIPAHAVDPGTGNAGKVLGVSADGSTLEYKAGAPVDPEEVRDLVAGFLVAGANITITHDDAGDTLTVTATAPTMGPRLVPVTTEVGGVPELVWDDENNLLMTEVPE